MYTSTAALNSSFSVYTCRAQDQHGNTERQHTDPPKLHKGRVVSVNHVGLLEALDCLVVVLQV
jgi:hypothetical protein